MVEISSAGANYVKEKSAKSGKVEVAIHESTVVEGDDEILTLEDLAPDGSWGWMVALSMIVVLVKNYSN